MSVNIQFLMTTRNSIAFQFIKVIREDGHPFDYNCAAVNQIIDCISDPIPPILSFQNFQLSYCGSADNPEQVAFLTIVCINNASLPRVLVER